MYNFAIIGATGDIVADNVWTAEALPAVDFSVSPDMRTTLVKKTDDVLYLVNNASVKDFRRLGDEEGFSLGPISMLKVGTTVRHRGQIFSRLSVLEYAADRTRLGEVSTKTNTYSLVALRPETAYIVIAIRVSGIGEIEFIDCDIQSTPERPTRRGPYVEVLERPSGELLAVSTTMTDVARTAGELQETASRLRASIESLSQQVQPTSKAQLAGEGADEANGGAINCAHEKRTRELLEAMALSLPESDGSRHFEKIPLSIGIISDVYMYNFYKDALNEVHYLSPSNYKSVLEENNLDAIVYITCWKGRNDEEWKGVKFRETPREALGEILRWARESKLTTIFQSIEDPSNYDYFLPIAREFDAVFTSDTDMIPRYIEDLGHERVYYGEYGANPILNNPIGTYRFDLPQNFFAGSYPERYQERIKDMETLFSSIPESDENLLIADRNFEIEGYDFPADVRSSIIGPFAHDVLQRVHKLFRRSINFNSIKSSPTMCAMRVYELQAHGKPILSNYARSVFNKFPEIRIVAERNVLSSLSQTDFDHEEFATAQRAMHNTLQTCTSFQVISRMMERVGLSSGAERSRRILVIGSGDLTALRKVLGDQRLADWDLVDADTVDVAKLDLSAYGYVARMDSAFDYGSFYLVSRMSAFMYTNAEFVTQHAVFESGRFHPGAIHEYTRVAAEPFWTMVSTDSESVVGFADGSLPSLSGHGYATDPYEVGFRSFIRDREVSNTSTECVLSVIVPVYNNGRFLRNKCLPSLQRNRVWHSMEVLLVDDGSTDRETLDFLEAVVREYPNVRVERFFDGGSGSASRPRNRGLELASGELVTFLDPDNEISERGYDNLLDTYYACRREGFLADFISGYQVKVGGSTTVTGRHASGQERRVTDTVGEYFARGRFPVVSTQAAVINRSFLEGLQLRYVERAAGQDTLFGWELLAGARNAVFVDNAHLIYYAERDDSVTNSVDRRYFEKSLIMERAQVAALSRLGLLGYYKEHHLENFMKNWYLKRLDLVCDDEALEARSLVSQIADLYEFDLSRELRSTSAS